MLRWSVEYSRAHCSGNAFVRAEDRAGAIAQFKALYPGAYIDRITCLGPVD